MKGVKKQNAIKSLCHLRKGMGLEIRQSLNGIRQNVYY
jgi:hypothetical protein